MNNQRIIEQIDGWRSQYPAFAYCSDLGQEWYLPAVEELKKIHRVNNIVNKQLEQQGGVKLNTWLWSSSEGGVFRAWGVGMSGGYTLNNLKLTGYYVRAVAVF